MSSQRYIDIEVAKILKKLGTGLEGPPSWEYFDSQHPEIAEEFPSDVEKIRRSTKGLEGYLRKIYFWNDVGVEHMNRRLLQLSLRYRPKREQFFSFKEEIGPFTIPTRVDRLNKISLLAEELLLDIFPRIEGHLNFDTESESEQIRTIRGTVDWNRTILDSLRSGQKLPLQFSCIVTQERFDTPENSLALYSVLRLQYDLDFVLFGGDGHIESLSLKEIRMLRNLKNLVDGVVSHTKLWRLIPKIDQYKSYDPDSRFVRKEETRTHERIRRGIVKQKSYTDLIKWLRKYRGYNIRSLLEKFRNFPAEHEKSFDTMYELWIIFEIMAHLEKKGMQFITTLESNTNAFAGFTIRYKDVVFNLNYQKDYTGWTDYDSRPDCTVQIEGTEDAPIIMDPKNWSSARAGDAVHKMLGYLTNLRGYNAHTGILFFSHAIGQHMDKDGQCRPYLEKRHESQGSKLTLLSFYISPKNIEYLQPNLEIVYEHVLGVCSKAMVARQEPHAKR